jgi:N-acetyl-beta-hexosaminidase
LETLNQLITYDDVTDGLVIMRDANITDSPAFPFRSLALDTSRNYFSVASIKRTIDGMAASKLNTFHWHLTDSHSFPFQSQTYPQLSQYGAYTPHQVRINAFFKLLICMGLKFGLLQKITGIDGVGEKTTYEKLLT